MLSHMLNRESIHNIPKFNKFPSVNNRNIYNALYSTLIYLRPVNCLEIGTFHGASARVFQQYFDDVMPNGKLITCDIKKYVDLSDCKNVTQLIVHPHVTNSTQWHYVTNEEILEPIINHNLNTTIIQKEFDKKFDFCFLDGDHQYKSALEDWYTASYLLHRPKYILFDDIDEPGKSSADAAHDSVRFYEELKESPLLYNIYDFSDWNEWVGAALIWERT